MKKVLMFLLTLLMVFSLSMTLACKPDEQSSTKEKVITSVEYLSGMPTSVFLSTSPSLANFKVKITYDDGTTEEVAYSNDNKADFSVECDTSEIGETDVTVTYKEYSFDFTLEVFMDIKAVNAPSFLTYFNKQKAEDSSFKDKTHVYTVGDDSAFFFSPVVYTMIDGAPVSLDEPGEVEVVASLSVLNGEAYEPVSDMATYVEFNGKKASFDFNESATGKTFKIAVYPVGLTDAQMENLSTYTKEIEINVVDGYNVYNANDLLLWDNKNADVAALRVKNGLTVDANSVKSLVLHSNIFITANDLPSSYFYHEDAEPEVFDGLSDEKQTLLEGSLKDSLELLTRELGKTDTFDFEGNYFTIDTSAVPYIMMERNDSDMSIAPTSIVSHAVMFSVDGVATQDGTDSNENFTVNNVDFIGNLNRQENIVSSGGLMLMKARKARGQCENLVAKRWYTTVFIEQNATGHDVLVNNCILEDSYNCLIYVWGGIINITNSRVYGAGGPAIIADHCYSKESNKGRTGSGGWTSDITVDENSTIASYVTGQEAWFAEFNATPAAAQIVNLDALFKPLGRTFTTVTTDEGGNSKTLINLAILLKSGDAEGMTFDKISGKVTIGDNHKLDFDSPDTSAFIYNKSVVGTGAPIFQSATERGIILINPMANPPVIMGLTGPVDYMALATGAAQHPLFDNDTGYLNLFFGAQNNPGYMGIVLGDYKAL